MLYGTWIISARDEALQEIQGEDEQYTRDVDWSTIRDMQAEIQLDDDME